jgi:hypothetical protein
MFVGASRADVLSIALPSPTGRADLAERQGTSFRPYFLVSVTHLSYEVDRCLSDNRVRPVFLFMAYVPKPCCTSLILY